MSFPTYVYEKFFANLATDGEEFVHFYNFMPYLMTYFLYSQFKTIKEHKKLFDEILGEEKGNKIGLFVGFVKHGLTKETMK
jgi:hypothetical protein